MAQLFANNATSTLDSGINDSDNTILLPVGEGARFPSPAGGDFCSLTITQGVGLEESWEIVKCTSRSGDTLTVERAQEGTAAVSWAAGSKVELRLTKAAIEGKQDALVSGANIKTIGGQSLLGGGDIALPSVTLSGPTTLYVTQQIALSITNFNAFASYSVAASDGSVSRTGDQITYTADSGAGNVTLTVTMNGADSLFTIVVHPASVAAPTITSPANGATNQPQAPTFTAAPFSAIGASDTHLNSDHEVRTGPNGTGVLVASSMADAANKVSWTMPGSLLATTTEYYYRTRHRGALLGEGGWSEISFTTAATFGGLIGTQGGQGFGAGVCANASLLTALGLSAMTGSDDKTHANYGNYQHTNGGVSVCIPKHFVRVGSASSPRYAAYGANAHDVVGIETFANETAANAAGYYLPRCFINGGVEVDYVFVDKYLASKDGSGSCKSVFGGTPISLTTAATYTNSNGMVTPDGTCTGIYADAVMLARARGAGWRCEAFEASMIATLALAHGQAATSDTYCAWYDASGVTNFPKGCNNNALADHLDGSVTYASAGDSGSASKPKCGAITGFAKTTHNGQACGVADINGSMWQVLLGLTQYGDNATASAQIATGTDYQKAYVLKRGVDISTLTAGWNGVNDVWGDATNLATKYDLVADIFPWTASASTYFGSGSNQVFDGATSGTGYLRTACGIPKDSSATDATGTNQFGNDYNYAYNRQNLFVLSAGDWSSAANAGAFYRNWDGSRSNDSYYVGFRAVACG